MAAGMTFRRIGGRIIPIAKKAGQAIKQAGKKNIFAKGKQAKRVKRKLISRDAKRTQMNFASLSLKFDQVGKNSRARSVIKKTETREANVGLGVIAGGVAGISLHRNKDKIKKKMKGK